MVWQRFAKSPRNACAGSTLVASAILGDEREMESGLIFNQLICKFDSRHPYHDITKVARINPSALFFLPSRGSNCKEPQTSAGRKTPSALRKV